jgi:Flp pilus assembly protein TadB
MSPLYNTTAGHQLIGIGVVGIAIGTVLLRKIVSFKG